MKTSFFALACLLLLGAAVAMTTTSADETTEEKGMGMGMGMGGIKIPGAVVHGLNCFNNKPIQDWSSLGLPTFMAGETCPAFFRELTTGAVIDENTSGDAILATSDSFVSELGMPTPVDGTLDVPIVQGSTITMFSTGITDRVPIIDANDDSAGRFGIRRAECAPSTYTLDQWNAASGELEINDNGDGSYNLKVSIKDAVPCSVYTLWNVGLGTSGLGVAPLGSMPNTFKTNDKGDGEHETKINFDIQSACGDELECTLYVSALYHNDFSVYGGAPDVGFAGLGGGVIGFGHVEWISFQGTPAN